MAPDGVVEAVDVTTDGVLGLGPGLENGAPNQLGLMAQAHQKIGYTSEPVPFRFPAWKNH